MKKSHKNKVKPEDVGHPIFMIVAYPLLSVKSGKRARKVLYFHHMSKSEEFLEIRSSKRGGQNVSLSEALRIRDTWVHSILTSFFSLMNEEPVIQTDLQVQTDVWGPR